MSILFKYISSQRTLFEDGFIRASQLSTLNDPFEAIYCEESLNELASHFDDSNVLELNVGEISFSDYVEKHKNRIGIISLTEAKDNPLMWAHYANNHEGIIAGFAKLEIDHGMFVNLFRPNFNRSRLLFNGVPESVIYRRQPRYRVDKFDFDYSNICIEGGSRILHEIFLQKSDEWIYEKEHRIILRLEQADKVRVFDLEKISNADVKNTILKSDWCSFQKQDDSYEIILMDIKDESLRFVVAEALASLSLNKKNVYLFKLKPNAITHCIFGLKSKCKYQDVMNPYVNSVGYFEVWKANKDRLNYSIGFEQIYE